MTRLAALRIIDDSTAPQGLRDFLKQNMPYSLADCRTLALSQTVGLHPETSEFDQGLDHWVTMPDQIRNLPEGQKKIEPYGGAEGQMHFLDLEAFGPRFVYSDDLSSKPDVDLIPHDLADPRWKRGGFLPWRVEEMYRRLIEALGPGDRAAHPDDALKAAGYLAHYVEDATQPHHATIDFNSASYLVGHIKQLPITTRPGAAALAAMRLPVGVNPHGDLEFQLFASADPLREAFRAQFWALLLTDIDRLTTERQQKAQILPTSFDPFRWNLNALGDSYDYLPVVGHAAVAAYASGRFDVNAFLGFEGKAKGKTVSVIQLIALRNARGVLDVEQCYRLAWSASHSTNTPPG